MPTDDSRPIPVVDDDGNPMSLEEALARRDELVKRAGLAEDERRGNVKALDAAQRLGRLQAQLDLINRRRK